MAVAAAPVALSPTPRRSIVAARRRLDPLDIIFGVGPTLAMAIVMGALIAILSTVVFHGAGHLNRTFLLSSPSSVNPESYGIFPTIVGTAALVVLMIMMALPLGVCAAIYLTEYAGNSRLARIIRAAVNNLAGVPSIVFGLFGVGFFVLFVGRLIDRATQPLDAATGQPILLYGQPALFWAAATLACLVLPVIIVSTEEALLAVPQSFREGALALGASKWQTIWEIVLPQSRGGILTGAILAISRGAGETAPILFTGAAYFLPKLPLFYWHGIPIINPWSQFMEMAYHIYTLVTQSTDPQAMLPHQFGTTLVLLLLTFGLNLVAIVARYRFRKTVGG
ncbi:MAG: phosphate ABC transporter permease PstA [bacterium]